MCWCIYLDIILLAPEPGLVPVSALLERFGVLVCFPGYYSACSRARTSTRTCFAGCQRSRQDSTWNPSQNRLLQMSQSSSQKRWQSLCLTLTLHAHTFIMNLAQLQIPRCLFVHLMFCCGPKYIIQNLLMECCTIGAF